MSDSAQLALREPAQCDWLNYNAGGSTYSAPPQAQVNGQNVIFYGVTTTAEERINQYAVDAEGNPYLNFLLDNVKLVNGPADGYLIRFTEASTKPFEKNGKIVVGNPNKLANYLRACGTQAKPQTNDQYRAAVKACLGKRFPFVADWEARNSDTGEKVKGFLSFPDDPERPGQKKAILKAGDVYTVRDFKGNITETKTVTSEVLFANLKLRFFVDPTRGAK